MKLSRLGAWISYCALLTAFGAQARTLLDLQASGAGKGHVLGYALNGLRGQIERSLRHSRVADQILGPSLRDCTAKRMELMDTNTRWAHCPGVPECFFVGGGIDYFYPAPRPVSLEIANYQVLGAKLGDVRMHCNGPKCEVAFAVEKLHVQMELTLRELEPVADPETGVVPERGREILRLAPLGLYLGANQEGKRPQLKLQALLGAADNPLRIIEGGSHLDFPLGALRIDVPKELADLPMQDILQSTRRAVGGIVGLFWIAARCQLLQA